MAVIYLRTNTDFCDKILFFQICVKVYCRDIIAVLYATFLLLYMDFFAKIMYHNMIDKYVNHLKYKALF